MFSAKCSRAASEKIMLTVKLSFMAGAFVWKLWNNHCSKGLPAASTRADPERRVSCQPNPYPDLERRAPLAAALAEQKGV